MKRNIAVIGLGRLGLTIVQELSALECSVLAIDKDPSAVARAGEFVRNAVVCDCTDQEAMIEVGMKEIDHAIVAFGEDMHDTVMATIVLKEIGVQQITVRVDIERYNNVMKRLGATDIISPQHIAGVSLAMRVASNSIVDYYRLVGEYCIARIIVKRSMTQSIVEADLRNACDINIMLISRGGRNIATKGSDRLMEGDTVTVFGTSKAISGFEAYINGK